MNQADSGRLTANAAMMFEGKGRTFFIKIALCRWPLPTADQSWNDFQTYYPANISPEPSL